MVTTRKAQARELVQQLDLTHQDDNVAEALGTIERLIAEASKEASWQIYCGVALWFHRMRAARGIGDKDKDATLMLDELALCCPQTLLVRLSSPSHSGPCLRSLTHAQSNHTQDDGNSTDSVSVEQVSHPVAHVLIANACAEQPRRGRQQ
jgi:hypothetical protein